MLHITIFSPSNNSVILWFVGLVLEPDEADIQERKTSQNIQVNDLPVTPSFPNNNIVDMQGSISQNLSPESSNSGDLGEVGSPVPLENEFENNLEGNSLIASNSEIEENTNITDNEKVKILFLYLDFINMDYVT